MIGVNTHEGYFINFSVSVTTIWQKGVEIKQIKKKILGYFQHLVSSYKSSVIIKCSCAKFFDDVLISNTTSIMVHF